MKTFTVEQIRKYLQTQDSFGDVFYNLSEENIEKANKPSKSQLQEEYEALEFAPGSSVAQLLMDLAKKHNLSYEDLLDEIEL